MPEPLKQSEIDKGQDPSVTKQWDDDVSLDQKMEDFGKIADGLGISMMGTLRNGVGPVGRAMAVAKRSGPDFLFLANAHSQKFDDIEKNKVTNVYFHDSTTQDWISITGETVVSNNEDPRIKKIWTEGVKAWFGDLGDGKHNGQPEDPRMKLIEVKANMINYWQHTVGKEGFGQEIKEAIQQGKVANTGSLRRMDGKEIEQARSKFGEMSSSS
ncbi:uncharacterized protein LTR77_003325 [Saxophila tyrrhenica]|uniref:General stress protein FMN-binding split barrel domain-containing protein n=1 Tax=Saxophila tyrrhenica TaxID=1690608 RepID=A0AAV9PIU4_9PEZI|nr:hypothetical protein LTR77_003325 [Saxophila tyrrhenica]